MKDPDNEVLTKAEALHKKGEYTDVLEVLQVFLSGKEPKDPLTTLDALILMAEASWRLGKLDDGHDAVHRAEKLLSSKELEELQENEDIRKKKAKILQNSGVIHWYRGDLERALECLQQCLSINEKLGDKDGVSAAFNNIGLVHWTKGDLDQATDYYKKSLAINEELNDDKGIASVLNNLANISSFRGELDQALTYQHQSLVIREKLAIKQDIARCLINIGVFHRLKGDLDQSTEYYNKSLAIQEDLSIGPDFALALNNLGDVYSLKGDIDIALEFYQRSLLIYDDMGAKEGIALTLANIGDCHARKSNPEYAFEYYQRSLHISEDMGNTRLISVVLSELMSLALDNNDFDMAKDYLTKLEQINIQSDNAILNQRHLISKAKFLKKSQRSRDRVKAEEILQELVEEDVGDHALTTEAMIHLCDLLLLELKATRAEEVLDSVKDLTQQLVKVAEDQASHPLVVETYLLQSKLALIDFEVNEARRLMTEAKKLADEKGLNRLGQIVQNELDTLQHEVKRWESILEEKPSKKEMVNLTNLDDLLARMVQKTVESLGIEPTTELARTTYSLVHKDLLKGTDKSEKGKFRVGIAQMGLSESGDILNELYEEKGEGLIGLREDSVESTRTKLKDLVEKAHSEGVNILIFPEMTIDLNFKQLADELEKLAKEYGMYIVSGSYHDRETRRNVCKIYGPDGVHWEQEKHIPAIIHIEGKRFIEKIETSVDSRNTIICNTEYGRIAIVICRDFLDMDLRVELKNSDPPVDLVINPAFTPVTADFKAAHFDARRSIYAYCFFANVAEFGDSLIYTPERERIERNLPKGEEDIIYKDVNLFQLRSERKKWEEQRKKQTSFIQSTR
ncbi:MAG: tetratricopeptide repeat protein [Candidatus Thorarchaeota archaeon]